MARGQAIRIGAALLVASNLSACGALIARHDENRWGTPYAGTKYYVQNRCWHQQIMAYALISAMVPFVIVDFPLTVAADTLMLPVDLGTNRGTPKNQYCYEEPVQNTFAQYVPEAEWGKRSQPGGCAPPRIVVEQAEYPGVAVDVRMANEPVATNLKLKDPTLFVSIGVRRNRLFGHYGPGHPLATPVRVTPSTDAIAVELTDGTVQRIEVPEFQDEIVFQDWKLFRAIQIPLPGVEPQSLTVTLPVFSVDGKELSGSTIAFRYGKTT